MNRIHPLSAPLSVKVFATCFALALSASLAGSLILYSGSRKALRQELRSHLKGIAATAAMQIDPRLHELVRTRGDEASRPYIHLKQVLQNVRAANPGLRYVYTMRKTGRPDVWQFVVDAEEDPQNISHVGDEYDVSELSDMRKAYTMPSADHELSTDKWGTWLSGYAPIRNLAGHTVGIVGMDMSAAHLRHEEAKLREAGLWNALAAILVSALLSTLITKLLLLRVRAFSVATQKVGAGDLDCRVEIHSDDEIGELASGFNQMVDKLKESQARLVEQSSRDFLTGLFNHMYFQERLASELDRADRHGCEVSVLIIDLDRFKLFNDSLGHPIGDGILRQLAGVLKQCCRKMDVIARYGGDEFAIILPETDVDTAVGVGQRICDTVEAHPFRAVLTQELDTVDARTSDSRTVNLSVTIGAATYPRHHKTREGLVMAADIALCRAKHVARNSVRVYDEMSGDGVQVDPADLYEVLNDPNTAAVRSLAAAVDARDHYTSGHSERVMQYALTLAESMQLEPDIIDALRIAGLLHDLGKIGIADGLLNKPGSLTKKEREAMQEHPRIGGEILKRAPQLGLIVPGVLYHHEHWDGSGYPDKLSGESIPLIARILAIADAFDAMTSDRPYRKAMSVEDALMEMRTNAGKQFDPMLVKQFIGFTRNSVEELKDAA